MKRLVFLYVSPIMTNYTLGTLLISLLISCQISSPDQESRSTEYYTNMTGIISPGLEYKPRGRIDSVRAMEIPHYQVKYDHQGRLAEIAYYKYASPSAEAYYGTHKVIYDYKDREMTRSYYDANDHKSHVSRHYYEGGDIHQEIYELDAQGHKTQLKLRDTTNINVSTGSGIYRYTFEHTSDSTYIQDQYALDDSRRRLTTYFPFRRSEIMTDDLGHLYSITHLDTLQDQVISDLQIGYDIVLFDFDQYGNEHGWSFHSADGDLRLRRPLYDMDHGLAKVKYEFDWIDQRLGLYRSYTMRNLDTREQRCTDNNGIHALTLAIDKQDNLTSMAYYGTTDNPINHPTNGYHEVRIEYDASGQSTNVTYLNSEGVEINR